MNQPKRIRFWPTTSERKKFWSTGTKKNRRAQPKKKIRKKSKATKKMSSANEGAPAAPICTCSYGSALAWCPTHPFEKLALKYTAGSIVRLDHPTRKQILSWVAFIFFDLLAIFIAAAVLSVVLQQGRPISFRRHTTRNFLGTSTC